MAREPLIRGGSFKSLVKDITGGADVICVHLEDGKKILLDGSDGDGRAVKIKIGDEASINYWTGNPGQAGLTVLRDEEGEIFRAIFPLQRITG